MFATMLRRSVKAYRSGALNSLLPEEFPCCPSGDLLLRCGNMDLYAVLRLWRHFGLVGNHTVPGTVVRAGEHVRDHPKKSKKHGRAVSPLIIS